MTDNGRIDSRALYRISTLASIRRAFCRFEDEVYAGLEFGEEPDWDVVLVTLRQLHKETVKAGKRVKGMKELS